jgi:DNA-binding CsgD family transcriptional regulator
MHHPQAATAALAPVLDGSVPKVHPVWAVAALLLEAIARDALGDPEAAGRALERALDAAEPDRVLYPFLIHPAPGLLERHSRHRTRHLALISQILDLPGGNKRASPPGNEGGCGSGRGLQAPLTDGETRVLRYLPTNLPAPEIAGQLSLSVNTVRTHVRHVYEKLGAHGRTEAVERAHSEAAMSYWNLTALHSASIPGNRRTLPDVRKWLALGCVVTSGVRIRRQSSTRTITAAPVSPAAQPVNRPIPPPRSRSVWSNSTMSRAPVGPWG